MNAERKTLIQHNIQVALEMEKAKNTKKTRFYIDLIGIGLVAVLFIVLLVTL